METLISRKSKGGPNTTKLCISPHEIHHATCHQNSILAYGTVQAKREAVENRNSDFLYRQLAHSLIKELASGMFQPGTRFYSNRTVCRLWQVSQPTAKSAFQLLLENNLLEVRNRSGYYVTERTQANALLLLNMQDFHSLPAPETWKEKSKRLSISPPSRPYRIGVILPPIHKTTSKSVNLSELDNLYLFPPETRSLFSELLNRNCKVSFFIDDRSEKSREYILSLTRRERLHGIIAIRRSIEYPPLSPLVKHLLRLNIPVVTVFDDCEGLDVTSINLNNIALGYNAGKRFLRAGCSRLGVLVPPPGNHYYYNRLVGCRMAFGEGGDHERNVVEIIVNPNQPDLGELRALLRSRKSRINGIFMTNAGYIEPVLQLLKQLKLKVPRNISVLAVTGTPGRFAEKAPCDTMHLDFNEVGTRAVDAIIHLIEGTATPRAIFTGFTYRSAGTLGN